MNEKLKLLSILHSVFKNAKYESGEKYLDETKLLTNEIDNDFKKATVKFPEQYLKDKKE